MHQTLKTKICLVGDMLSDGGAERVTADLSNYFHNQGLEVYIVVIQDKVTYPYSGELLNLGLDKRKGILNKPARFFKLWKFFRKHKFDYVIDTRYKNNYLQEWMTNELLYEKGKIVFTIHSSILNYYIPKSDFLAKLVFRKAYGIVAVSNKVKNAVLKRKLAVPVHRIYNPVAIDQIAKGLHEEFYPGYRYILAAGSMNGDIKQFDRLIDAYAASGLPAGGVKLVILGKGKLKETYEKQAELLGLREEVVFPGYKNNPYIYMKHALFFVLSSRREGLGMVLIEALACGTPAVSFDCDAGPSEIIEHKVNGLLVKDQDFDELREAMDLLAQDEELYKECRSNASKSIDKFLPENVGRAWMDYLKI